MIEKIEKVINEWDPLELFPFAPKDEYILEIQELSAIIESKKICSVDILGQEIYDLFLRTLGEEIFNGSLEKCTEIAKKILF